MTTTITRDPVCGMELNVDSAAAACAYAGWTYLFCSQECRELFMQSPRDCILYLAHSRSGFLGYRCAHQRDAWQSGNTEAKEVLR